MTDRTGDPKTRVAEWHEPLLGTAIEVQLILNGEDQETLGRSHIAQAIEEIQRLQNLLSSVDPLSEFSRWSRGELHSANNELHSALSEAARWQLSSDGRFNPAVAELTEFWSSAQESGTVPTPHDAQRLADTIASPRWVVTDDGTVDRVGDCSRCTLNAFAKGWIVDRAVDYLIALDDVETVSVNAGGDLRRSGPNPLLVGIENPLRSFDNEPPLAAVSLSNAALATSGLARKGFSIGNDYFGHVIDPRTGWPVDTTASISVVADDAATADVLATILGVQQPTDAITEANEKGIPAFIVDCNGQQHRSDPWKRIEVILN